MVKLSKSLHPSVYIHTNSHHLIGMTEGKGRGRGIGVRGAKSADQIQYKILYNVGQKINDDV